VGGGIFFRIEKGGRLGSHAFFSVEVGPLEVLTSLAVPQTPGRRLKIDNNALLRVRSGAMKHPYDDTDGNQNPELCIAKSFSLRRKLIAGIRARAAYLDLSMSTYVATLVHNDLVRGIQAPLSIDTSREAPSGRGVVVPGFDLEEE
jgi:hypothetical protein